MGFDFKSKSISGVVKFQVGATAFLVGGNNVGRIGNVTSIEKHPGSFDIVHVKDTKGNSFSTRLGNVIVIVMERPTLFPFQREMVSDSLLSKRETPEEVMRRAPETMMMRKITDCLCL